MGGFSENLIFNMTLVLRFPSSLGKGFTEASRELLENDF